MNTVALRACVCVASLLLAEPSAAGALPRQLSAVRPASELPTQRHRWNTNEVTNYTLHDQPSPLQPAVATTQCTVPLSTHCASHVFNDESWQTDERPLMISNPIYKISYDLSQHYLKFSVRSTYDSDL